MAKDLSDFDGGTLVVDTPHTLKSGGVTRREKTVTAAPKKIKLKPKKQTQSPKVKKAHVKSEKPYYLVKDKEGNQQKVYTKSYNQGLALRSFRRAVKKTLGSKLFYIIAGSGLALVAAGTLGAPIMASMGLAGIKYVGYAALGLASFSAGINLLKSIYDIYPFPKLGGRKLTVRWKNGAPFLDVSFEKTGKRSRVFNQFAVKPLFFALSVFAINAFVAPVIKHWEQINNGTMSLGDAVREYKDFEISKAEDFLNFTENRIQQNRANLIASGDYIIDTYSYYGLNDEIYSTHPFGAELFSFAATDYVTYGNDPGRWAQTQMALIAAIEEGIDPRAMAVFSGREANGRDIVANATSGVGYYQNLDMPWFDTIYKYRERLIEKLRTNPHFTGYGTIADDLENLGKPLLGDGVFPGLQDLNSDPVYKYLQRTAPQSLSNMSVYDFYRKGIELNQRGIITEPHHDLPFLRIMDLRKDIVVAPLVNARLRMEESGGALAFEKTVNMSQQEFHVLVAKEWSKHHQGITRFNKYKEYLKTESGRNTVAAYVDGFKDAADRNPWDFYRDGKNKTGAYTFGELRLKYIERISSQVNDNYDRTQNGYVEITLRDLLDVPEEFSGSAEEAEAWKDRILGDDSVFYPNRRGYVVAKISDAMPEELISKGLDAYSGFIDTVTGGANEQKLPQQIAVAEEHQDIKLAEQTDVIKSVENEAAFVKVFNDLDINDPNIERVAGNVFSSSPEVYGQANREVATVLVKRIRDEGLPAEDRYKATLATQAFVDMQQDAGRAGDDISRGDFNFALSVADQYQTSLERELPKEQRPRVMKASFTQP